ncbi:MAG: pyruvate kinase [Planctomycetes bacterium]|nr:pyruvate kinase [Planctomycetota bacterium]
MTQRRTRLVCTISTPRTGGSRPQDGAGYVPGLIAAGMDVARVNLSHCGAAAEFAAGRAPSYVAEQALIRAVREASDAAGPERHVAVLLDLQGVKVRLRLPDALRDTGLAMEAGETVRVRITRERSSGEIVCDGSETMRRAVARAVAAGPLSVAIGDGEPFLRCDAVEGDVAVLVAPERCVLGHGKGVTFRNVHIDGEPPLTEKDRVDLAAFVVPALLAGDADFVALSFTQSGADVRRLREFAAASQAFFRDGTVPSDAEDAEILARLAAVLPHLRDRYRATADVRPFVVAKVETAPGADAMDDILSEADAVMVARGDLGLHCAPEDVPRLQKRMIRDARRLGRPAIVATQMLESMLTAPEPRRSEATDVFNAVLDGADAVMLSGETAVGQRPREAAATLARIAVAAESWETVHPETREAWLRAVEKDVAARAAACAGASGAPAPTDRACGAETVTDRVTAESVRTAEALGCAAVVAATRSGRTARNLARFDPMLPIVAIVPDERVARSLALTGSVRAVVASATSGDDALARGLARAVECELVRRGDRVVVASARPDDPPGVTTALSVRTV